MIFETDHIFHIYNQGNNRERIFFNHENYLLFLRKMEEYILPYADILAWCLMPNHFHVMVYLQIDSIHRDSLSKREAISTNQEAISKSRSFNDSIGYLIRSYTQAVNKSEKRIGSLFKAHSKAQCLTKSEGITPSYFNSFFGTEINVQIPEKEYPKVCWNYIHNNPVKAKMVEKPEDYMYSSYRDFCGLRNGKLINKIKAKEFGLFLNERDSLSQRETISAKN